MGIDIRSDRPRRHRQQIWGFLFIAPLFLILLTFLFFPFLYSILLSFTNWSGLGPLHFIGTTNYAELPSDPYFVASLLNTLLYLVFTIIPMVFFSLIIAITLNRRLRGIAVFRSALLMPYATSPVVVTIVFLALLDPSYGWINDALRALHATPIPWLTSALWAKVGISLMIIWQYMGYNAVIMLGGLQGISQEIYDSAMVDGAGAWSTLWRITVPLLQPTILFITITSTIGTFNLFAQPLLLTAGGPNNGTLSPTEYLYQMAFTDNNFGYASAIGVGIFLLTFIVSYFQIRRFATQ